jgi:hypothetical protein
MVAPVTHDDGYDPEINAHLHHGKFTSLGEAQEAAVVLRSIGFPSAKGAQFGGTFLVELDDSRCGGKGVLRYWSHLSKFIVAHLTKG